MIAGFLMTLVSSPIDVVKTRIMNERKAQGKNYPGAFACFAMVRFSLAARVRLAPLADLSAAPQTLKQEGFLGLYKGFMPAYMRLGPHTLMAFVLFEKLRNLAGYKPV